MHNVEMQEKLTRSGLKVTKIGLVSNVVLAVGKGAAGVLGNSAAMVADAGHSLADLAGDVVALYTVKYANKHPDDAMQVCFSLSQDINDLIVIQA